MNTQTKMTNNMSMRFIVLLGIATTVMLLALVLSLLYQPTIDAYAATSDSSEPSYTTTDRLYLEIPDRDKTMTFKTPGD